MSVKIGLSLYGKNTVCWRWRPGCWVWYLKVGEGECVVEEDWKIYRICSVVIVTPL